MLIKPFVANIPQVNTIADQKKFFKRVKSDYLDYKKTGHYAQDPSGKSIYLYNISGSLGNLISVICLTDVHEFLESKVKVHENIIEKKLNKQKALVKKRDALVKPILLGYRSDEKLTEYLQELVVSSVPHLVLSIDDCLHELYCVDNNQQNTILEALRKHEASYVCDGHHRSAAIQELYLENRDKYRFALTAYTDISTISISSFSRVVDCTGEENIMSRLKHYFNISPVIHAEYPDNPHTLMCCVDKEWYKLEWKEKYAQSSESDVILLNDLIFLEMLGIKDVRLSSRISYESSTDINQLTQYSNANTLVFELCPLNHKQFIDIVNSGQLLPPKSTAFIPRVLSGIITMDI